MKELSEGCWGQTELLVSCPSSECLAANIFPLQGYPWFPKVSSRIWLKRHWSPISHSASSSLTGKEWVERLSHRRLDCLQLVRPRLVWAQHMPGSLEVTFSFCLHIVEETRGKSRWPPVNLAVCWRLLPSPLNELSDYLTQDSPCAELVRLLWRPQSRSCD